MRRALLALLLVVSTALTGCAVEGGLDAAKTIAGAAQSPPASPPVQACPGGTFTTAGADGSVRCTPTFAGFECPWGEFVRGWSSDGYPQCARPTWDEAYPPSTPPEPVKPEPTYEVSSHLKVISVFGKRPDTTSDLDTLVVMLELAPGGLPEDLTTMVLRYATPSHAAHLGWGSSATTTTFQTTWVRGTPAGAMRPGDIVEIAFLVQPALGVRTSVELALIAETGAPVDAGFKTPPTYGSDRVITLR